MVARRAGTLLVMACTGEASGPGTTVLTVSLACQLVRRSLVLACGHSWPCKEPCFLQNGSA